MTICSTQAALDRHITTIDKADRLFSQCSREIRERQRETATERADQILNDAVNSCLNEHIDEFSDVDALNELAQLLHRAAPALRKLNAASADFIGDDVTRLIGAYDKLRDGLIGHITDSDECEQEAVDYVLGD